MRVLLSTYGSRGDVEPLVGLAVRSRALGAEVRVRAPQDWAERLPEVGVPLVPVRRPPGHRHGTAHDGPAPTTESLSAALRTTLTLPDPRTSDHRGRHDPHRRGGGGRDAAGRRGQPGKAASARVNNAGSSCRDPEHENLQTLVT